jgi:glycosyltransferase involved in cell wall biosynthesis
MKKNKYLISVILPIYNVEEYLVQAIESVVNQTIGFENIELILVNDGSPANEDVICKKYADKYDNVVYIKKENGGVSSARNVGIEAATADYISFLDPDDYVENNYYEEGIKMLEKHDEINFVTFRQHFFEADNDYHPSDYKFDKGSRIVDITKDYECIQIYVFNVIRRNAIKNIRFDEKIRFSEDLKFMTDVLFKNKSKKYGLVTTSEYMYRKRINGSSAMQVSDNSLSWYTYTSKNIYDYVLNLSKEVFGEIIRYAKYLVMYFLRHKLKVAPGLSIPQDEFINHDKHIVNLLKQIDDYIILEQRKFTIYDKIFTLNIKYGKDIQKDIKINNNDIFYKNIKFGNINDCYVNLDNFYKKDNKYVIELLVNKFLEDKTIVKVNGKQIDNKPQIYKRSYYNNFDWCAYEENLYKVITDNKDNKIEVFYDDKKLPIKSSSFMQNVNENNCVYKVDNYYLYNSNKSIILTNSISKKIKICLKSLLKTNSKRIKASFIKLLSLFYNKKETIVVMKKENKDIIEKHLKDNKIKNYKVFYKDSIKRNLKTKLMFINYKNIYEDNLDSNPINIFGKSRQYYNNRIKGNYYALVYKKDDEGRINKIRVFNKNTDCIKL